MSDLRSEVVDILAKMKFFQGQRAGRELWNDKPFEVQEKDLESFNTGIETIRKYILQLEEQSKVNEWIPCSERLPEKAGKYLVTMIEGGSVHTSVRRFNPKPKHQEQNEPVFTKHLPYYSGWERATKGVIAWMPLPEPWKGKV